MAFGVGAGARARAPIEVASRSPGTCGESLWLLPSGPDQVHDAAMRGDPPLIGRAMRARADYRPSAAHGKCKRRWRGATTLPAADGGLAGTATRRIAIIGRIADAPAFAYRRSAATCARRTRSCSPLPSIFVAVALVPALMPAGAGAVPHGRGPPPLRPPAEAERAGGDRSGRARHVLSRARRHARRLRRRPRCGASPRRAGCRCASSPPTRRPS